MISSFNSNPLMDLATSPIVAIPVIAPLSIGIANLSLIYNNKKLGTNIQLAYNLTGRRLETVSPDDGMDEYQNTIQDLDFSGEQTLFNNIKFYVKLVNLLNSPTEIEIPSGEYKKFQTLIIRKDFNRMRGSIGFSYRF